MARDMWASYPSREEVLRSLAMNMYLHVIDALPQLRVDPNKNLTASSVTPSCCNSIVNGIVVLFDEIGRIAGRLRALVIAPSPA
jgi:hypothetical protein